AHLLSRPATPGTSGGALRHCLLDLLRVPDQRPRADLPRQREITGRAELQNIPPRQPQHLPHLPEGQEPRRRRRRRRDRHVASPQTNGAAAPPPPFGGAHATGLLLLTRLASARPPISRRTNVTTGTLYRHRLKRDPRHRFPGISVPVPTAFATSIAHGC